MLNKNLAPDDLIEWMPFLQAYAKQGDTEHLKALAPMVVTDAFVAQQACYILGGLQGQTQPIVDVIDLHYCKK